MWDVRIWNGKIPYSSPNLTKCLCKYSWGSTTRVCFSFQWEVTGSRHCTPPNSGRGGICPGLAPACPRRAVLRLGVKGRFSPSEIGVCLQIEPRKSDHQQTFPSPQRLEIRPKGGPRVSSTATPTPDRPSPGLTAWERGASGTVGGSAGEESAVPFSYGRVSLFTDSFLPPRSAARASLSAGTRLVLSPLQPQPKSFWRSETDPGRSSLGAPAPSHPCSRFPFTLVRQ